MTQKTYENHRQTDKQTEIILIHTFQLRPKKVWGWWVIGVGLSKNLAKPWA